MEADDVRDRGLRQPQDHLGRQPVTELGIDMRGPDDLVRKSRPREGVLVGAAGATDHRNARATTRCDGGLDERFLGERGEEATTRRAEFVNELVRGGVHLELTVQAEVELERLMLTRGLIEV
mgnify:CR=1 FL=1